MDNCAVTSDSSKDLTWAYNSLSSIFDPYKFGLQQFATNDKSLQSCIDADIKVDTPTSVNLLGLRWDRLSDELHTRKLNLNCEANTKRLVLSTIASQYDIYNFNGPILNRARLFMHELQCNTEMSWDAKMSLQQTKEWRNIARQANAAPEIKISRFVGSRKDTYNILAFSDSSKVMYGTTLYLHNQRTGDISFVMAKNRIVNRSLYTKSIPALEVQGVTLATESIIELYQELAEPNCIDPINIGELRVYTDSLVALSWLQSYAVKFDKMQKMSVFVINKLEHLSKLCNLHAVHFSFIAGVDNPADCITRSLSYKQLMKTNYFTGPVLSNCDIRSAKMDTLNVTIPNPCSLPGGNLANPANVQVAVTNVDNPPTDYYTDLLLRCSSFKKLVAVQRCILIFANKLKAKLREKEKYHHLTVKKSDHNFYEEAIKLILKKDQQIEYSDICTYFSSSDSKLKHLPNLVW